jgi:hypothetical protein
MQKIMTGTTIRETVTNRDFASGPKINLPPNKNICIKEDKIHK